MDVVFAALPFADFRRPVIGVSLLQAALKSAGLESRVEYFNITFAELIGAPAYQLLASSLSPSTLVGEWFFADLVFGEAIPDEEDYLTRVLSLHLPDAAARSSILEARMFRSNFVDACVARIRQLRPRVVGFPTSFHQTCACLAVAQRLKRTANPPLVVFGGANCEGEMGWQLIRSFPWIDYVATGEADLSFPRFIANVLDGKEHNVVPGIIGRGEELSHPERVADMDALPLPDYSEFFERVKASSLGETLHPVALIETSRGCWWGVKQHCTFCGLNGETMAFRSKSAARCFQELASLGSYYDVKQVDCVDNILDTRYIQTLFPLLTKSNLDLRLFYEVKSNLRYEQLETLRDGGVYGIQPGIESFSDQVLRLMKKGCTGLQNIQLLRWCEELGIQVVWNILAGFPGELPGEYDRQAELIPLLTHLAAPACCAAIRLDRFSPFHTKPADFGFERVRPAAAYYYVFPLERRDLARLAYFFEFDYSDRRDPNSYLKGLREEITKWWIARAEGKADRPRLDAKPHKDGLLIEDTRKVARKYQDTVTGTAAQVYLRCDTAKSLPALARECGPVASESEIRTILEGFVAAKSMIEMADRYLSLAVFHARDLLKELKQSCDSPQPYQAPASESLLRVV